MSKKEKVRICVCVCVERGEGADKNGEKKKGWKREIHRKRKAIYYNLYLTSILPTTIYYLPELLSAYLGFTGGVPAGLPQRREPSTASPSQGGDRLLPPLDLEGTKQYWSALPSLISSLISEPPFLYLYSEIFRPIIQTSLVKTVWIIGWKSLARIRPSPLL